MGLDEFKYFEHKIDTNIVFVKGFFRLRKNQLNHAVRSVFFTTIQSFYFDRTILRDVIE